MTHEEDECDSASLFAVASQSDVNSFLHAQAAKLTAFNSNISDDEDEESSIDDSLLTRITQVSTKNSSSKIKPYLSRSCFAAISSQKQNIADDLTELKWLSTFKLKEFQDHQSEIKEKSIEQRNYHEDQISKLSTELKSFDPKNLQSLSFGVLIFHAFYSKRDEKTASWSLSIKQLYEYIQIHFKQITNQRGWKNLLKQTLITIPCFVKTKHDIPKSPSIWTIDPYYRPLLTKAYLTSLSFQADRNEEKQMESIVENFAPKATVKSKALPRLYERLCEEKVNDEDEMNSNHIIKRQRSPITARKRPRSTSSSGHHQIVKNNEEKRLSSSSPWTRKLNKRHQSPSNIESKTSTSIKSSHVDQMSSNPIEKSKKRIELSLDEDDECDSSPSPRSTRTSIITTRSQTAARGIKKDFVHRRKSSPPQKRLSLGLSSHRPNTRINRKIIEQDLELLRQAQPLDLSNGTSIFQTPPHNILDLSSSR